MLRVIRFLVAASVLLMVAALLLKAPSAHAKKSAPAAAVNEHPGVPGAFGLSPGQTARMSISNLSDRDVASAPTTCSVCFYFYDEQGNTILRADRDVAPGQITHVDLTFESLNLPTTTSRVQILGAVALENVVSNLSNAVSSPQPTPTATPTPSFTSNFNPPPPGPPTTPPPVPVPDPNSLTTTPLCIPTLEVFDSATGQTKFIWTGWSPFLEAGDALGAGK